MKPQQQANVEPELLGIKEVRILCGNRSTSWVYDRMRHDPAFPRPVKLARYTNAWYRRELLEYFATLPRLTLSGMSGPDNRIAAREAAGAA
jgi:predicted DNA-binding transcriptional regulator AlpA